jgi:23S rRNA pseudouridine2604 synthase
MNEPQRLAKRVVQLTACSRREAEFYIEGGWVLVDGEVVELPQFMVTDQVVSLHPEARPEPLQPATFLLHAPLGFDAVDGAQNVQRWLLPAMRSADDDSGVRPLRRHGMHLGCPLPLEDGGTGLLAYTQDPRVARRLREDGEKLEQEYIVDVEGTIDDGALARVERGLQMDGRTLSRVRASRQNEQRLRLALMGARPGQVRFLCEQMQLLPLAMRRIRIGRVAMGKLAAAHWRYLPAHERF